MGLSIDFNRIPDFLEGQTNPKCQAYGLDFDQRPFGFLYVDENDYTIAWSGYINFFKIEKEIFRSLSERISSRWKRADISESVIREAANVLIVISKGVDELLEFKLSESTDYQEYRKILHSPKLISFIQFDIKDEAGNPDFKYSVTAERNNRTLHRSGEIAVSLPRHHEIKEGLMDWIV